MAPYPYLHDSAVDTQDNPVEILAERHDYAVRVTYQLKRFDYGPENTARYLYYSLIELTGAIVCLCRDSRYSCVPVIARSALEAFVDLGLILNNADYENNLVAASLTEEQWLFSIASQGKNKHLVPLLSLEDFNEIRKVPKKALKDLPPGTKGFDAKEKFDAIEMPEMLNSYWKLFSAHAHNNYSVLSQRHVQFVNDRPSPGIYLNSMKLFCENIAANFAFYLSQASNRMLNKFAVTRFESE